MHVLLFAFFWVWSTLGAAQSRVFAVYGPRLTAQYQLDQSAFLPQGRLSLDEIQTQLPQLRSYQEFLDYIAVRRPSLLENPVLIHDTGSLQYADRERPRVILFGDGLMLAFAEDPRRVDRSVEIIAFDERNSRFEFAAIDFRADGPRYQADPKNCQSCHGSSPKPLWEPYDFWPNAYGSMFSRLGTTAERNAYEGLRKQQPKSGIYAKLQWPAQALGNGSLEGVEAFTQYVSQLQIVSSLPRWQKQSPSFQAVVPALLAVLNHCAVDPDDARAGATLAEFFPETWRSRIETNFASWHQRVKEDRKRFKAYQDTRYLQVFPSRPAGMNHERLGGETQTLAQIYLVLELAGVDTRDFTLSQGPNSYLMSVPSNFDADFVNNMALVAPDIFQRLAPKFIAAVGYNYSWARFPCASLQSESLSSLQGQTPAAASRLPWAPTVFGECISCHSLKSGTSGAPPIPFDRTGSLRAYLQSGGLEKILERTQKIGPGQMPPYRRLGAEEQEQLRINLELIQK